MRFADEFISCSKALAAELGIATPTFSAQPDGDIVNSSDSVTAHADFQAPSFSFSISLSPTGTSLVAPSTLYLQFFTPYDEFSFPILSYDVMAHLPSAGEDFRAQVFSHIESGERICACFAEYQAFFARYYDELCNFFADQERVERLLDGIRAEAHDIGGFDFDEEYRDIVAKLSGNYVSIQLMRYTSAPYTYFLSGNLSLARKKYGKMKNRLNYEARLYSFICSLPVGSEYVAISPEAFAYGDVRHKLSRAENGMFILCFFIGIVLSFPAFALLYFVFAYASAYDAIYYTALEPYNMCFASLPAVFVGIVAAHYLRPTIYRMLHKKDVKAMQAFALTTSEKSDKTIRVLTHLILIFSIVFTLMSACEGLVVTNKGIIDRSGFFNLRGTLYECNELDSIWLVEGYTDEDGEWYESDSYIVLAKNGDRLDFFQYVDPSTIPSEVITWIESFAGKVRPVRSDTDVQLK